MAYTCAPKFWGVQSGLRTAVADDSLNKPTKHSCTWLISSKQLNFYTSLCCCILVEHEKFSWWKCNHRYTKPETKNTRTSSYKAAGIFEFEDLLYLWSKSVWVNEKHTEKAIYLVRTIFNTKHVLKLFEEKYFPHPIIEWFVVCAHRNLRFNCQI